MFSKQWRHVNGQTSKFLIVLRKKIQESPELKERVTKDLKILSPIHRRIIEMELFDNNKLNDIANKLYIDAQTLFRIRRNATFVLLKFDGFKDVIRYDKAV